MSRPPRPDRRAARLVRWYPRSWRARYGEEFVALLVDDISERPRAPRRTLDVMRGGLFARLTAGGLAGDLRGPADQLRSSLAAIGCFIAAFLVFGVSLWSQLTIGWQWSAPSAPLVEVALEIMSAALLALIGLALLAAVPAILAACRGLLGGQRRELAAPALLFLVGATVLVVGSAHFAPGWPGTGGRPWADKGLVPAGPASFAWAATLSVTAYWAHPDRLGGFPAIEVAWMALAPLAMLVAATGGALTVRRLRLSPRVLRYEARLASLAALALLEFLCGATSWTLWRDPSPRHLFAPGVIDALDVSVMAVLLMPALHLTRRARRLLASDRARA